MKSFYITQLYYGTHKNVRHVPLSPQCSYISAAHFQNFISRLLKCCVFVFNFIYLLLSGLNTEPFTSLDINLKIVLILHRTRHGAVYIPGTNVLKPFQFFCFQSTARSFSYLKATISDTLGDDGLKRLKFGLLNQNLSYDLNIPRSWTT